ncbi:hypothetical protein N665_3391s0003 [Sinapis alba]|nr:hypothetical protein N665_3391s0003 [Sinapis alba]
MKPNGKSSVSSASDEKVMFFKEILLGPHETLLRFRLIHFWEARNPLKKTLIGLEMLLIDEQVRTVIQGFIPPGRIEKYLPDMKQGFVYKLNNFYGSKNKTVYRVADHSATVSFSWNSELSALQDSPIPFDEDRFRFHSYEDFKANCDLKGDLYELIFCSGHVMKLYLWDQAATDFCKKFKSYENTPTVLLVTTVNTKRLGVLLPWPLCPPSRVFMDYDVQPTIDYFTWLGSNPEIAKQFSAEVVTKRETLTIAEIFSYIKQESAKEAFFECTATIDDVVHGSAWYYIACSGCHTKATKGPTSLMCSKCGKVNIAGVAQYRAKISVYDNSDQAVFVLLGDAGRELTGKHASELVSSYFEANENQGANHEVPVPEALVSTIGQTHKFCVKVTEHNLSGKTRAITVTKILYLDTPPATEASVGNAIAATSEETLETGNDVCEASKSRVDSADEGSKRTCDSAKEEKAKRPKCGN